MDKRPEDGFSFDASIFTSDGSAAQPGDYSQVDDTVTFSRNDFSRVTVNGERRYRAAKQVLVPIQDDISDEDEEDFTITMAYANPGPPHLQGGPATMSVGITDNDFVPVTISWDQSFVSVDEYVTTVTLQARATTTSDRMPESGFTIALSATTAGDTATQGSDYRRLNSNFSFSQGDFTRTAVGGQFRFQATRDISVSIIDDTVDEPNEDFTVVLSYSDPSLSHLRGGPDAATVTIADNDHVPVTLGWEETQFTAEEPTSPCTTTRVIMRAMAVTATNKQPESGFTFGFTVNTADGSARQPADYERLSTTETFGRNDFSPTTVDGQFRWVAFLDVTVLVQHDIVDEPPERFRVLLAFVGPNQPYLLRGDMTATVTTTDDIASLADLNTTVNSDKSFAAVGDEITYSWTLSNSGPASTTNTVLTGSLDAGVTFVSATVSTPPTGQCRRSDRTVTCSLGTVDTLDTASGEIVVKVAGSASADITFTAAAEGDQLDSTPADNDDSVTTELDAPPEQVMNLSPVRSSAAFIELSWARPSDNGSPITRYELERKEAGESYALVSPGPGVAATTYRDNQVAAGATYTYQLRAVNADGDAEWSNEATATATEPPPPPPPPRQTTVIGGGGGGVPRNRSPAFAEGDATTRTVAENTAAGQDIGAPLEATDADRQDTLTYTLEGEDAASFDIDAATGQLRTKAPLDYETKSSYILSARVEDRRGRSDAIEVTVEVTNVGLDGMAGQYDRDDNGAIDRDEAIAAVVDYFNGVISKEEAIEVVRVYFAG